MHSYECICKHVGDCVSELKQKGTQGTVAHTRIFVSV